MDQSGILAQTEGESNDGINGLPNCILSSILSLLTIKDAVDTSMISRQWRHRWLDAVLTRPNLEFDIPNIFGSRYAGPYCKYDPGHHLTLMKQFKRQVFVRRVNTVLDLYRGRKIESFKVSFLLDGKSTKILDGWIGFAIRKGVEVLDIELFLDTDNHYVFPCTLLSELDSSALKHLSLSVCALRPPPDFDGFNQLTSLCLDSVTVDEGFMSRLLPVCLFLESLTLSECIVGKFLIVAGPLLRLKDLKVLACPKLSKIEISTANLASFEYAGNANLSFIKTLQIARAYLGARQNHTLTYALTHFALSPRLETLHLHIGPTVEIPETVSTFRHLKKLDLDVYLKGRVADIDLTCVLHLRKATPLLEELDSGFVL